MFLPAIFTLICLVFGASGKSLEVVSDNTLIEYISSEAYVVVLFTKKDSNESDEYETELVKIRSDLVESLGDSTSVVKSEENSNIWQVYTPNKLPALIYIRGGIPILYEGKLNEDDIYQFIVDNKEPIVRELTDENFEHLTQASSGATTGDWFVMFYSHSCVECQRMGARWEAVASKLKYRTNVVRVNKDDTGATTARRFNVIDAPEFILFRKGKMYRYQIPKYDVKTFVSFAEEWFRNAHGEKIPVPQSPFDDMTMMIAIFLRQNPWVFKLGSIIMAVVIIVSVASKLRRKADLPEKKGE